MACRGFVLILLVLFIQSCELTKPASVGGDDQIIVFADSSQWEISSESLSAIVEREVTTPQPETEFYLQHVDLSLFDVYKKYKTLVFIGNLSSNKPVSTTIQDMLGLDAQQAVLNQNYFIFSRQDEWARNQLVLVLVSPEADQLNRNLQTYADDIYETVNRHTLGLVQDFLYSTSAPLRDKTLPQRLSNKYGWSIRVHPDFDLAEELPDSNYVRFHSPSKIQSLQRWITVYWEKLDSSESPGSVLSNSWMARSRNELGKRFVDPVLTVDRYDRFGTAIFAGRPSVRYDGVWKTVSIKDAFGGAFRSYGFYEPSLHSVFFIDLAVFFPEEKHKLKYLRELDAIAQTFSVQSK